MDIMPILTKLSLPTQEEGLDIAMVQLVSLSTIHQLAYILHNNGHYMEEFLLDIQGNNHHICHSVT